jgi:chromosome segregation ATPase
MMMRRIVGLMLIGLSLTGTAIANGILEDLRQRYFHEIYDAYKESAKFLEAGNQVEGRKALEKLHEEIVNVRKPVEEIRRQMVNVLRLNSDLAAKWLKLQEGLNVLEPKVKRLKDDVGLRDTRSDVSEVKDLFERFGSELNANNDALVEYGKRLLANEKRLDDLRSFIASDVSSAHRETVEKLSAQNTRDGEVAIKKLQELLGRGDDMQSSYHRETAILSAALFEYWQPASSAMASFKERVRSLASKVGTSNYDGDLREATDAFQKLRDELTTANDKTKDFTKRFQGVCDSCR